MAKTKARRIRDELEKLLAKELKATDITKGPCPYCMSTMVLGHLELRPTRDHIKPRSRFPVHKTNGRCIIVCSRCNFMKADMTLSEFLLYLEKKNKLLQEAINLNRERIENISYLLRIGIEE